MPALLDSAPFPSNRAKAMLEKYGAVTSLTVQVARAPEQRALVQLAVAYLKP